jgi:hypothetical protein
VTDLIVRIAAFLLVLGSIARIPPCGAVPDLLTDFSRFLTRLSLNVYFFEGQNISPASIALGPLEIRAHEGCRMCASALSRQRVEH